MRSLIHLIGAAALAAAAAVTGYFGQKVFGGMRMKGSTDLDYVIVLGARVKGTVPSRSLALRISCAKECMDRMPDAVFILSGGQGSDEEISEAACMRECLLACGADPERIIMEDRSTSTRENLQFSDALTGCGSARTGILSNDFHIYRAVALAKKMGYAHPEGIAAPSDPVTRPRYILREICALAVETLKGEV